MDPKDTAATDTGIGTQDLCSDELLSRARKAKAANVMRKGVAASAMALAGAQGMSCANDETGATTANDTEVSAPNIPRPGNEATGQYQGERRTDMVSYKGDYWTEMSNCGTRAGCMDYDFILKVFVKPVQGANLDAKRVGVLFRVPSWQAGRAEMALGQYYATNNDTEEWHVRIRLHPWMDSPQALVFDAFYQDGVGHTYYDDNNGEFHVAAQYANGIIRQMWCCENELTQVQVNSTGVSGQIGVVVSDLDYDKELDLLWTTDAWAHTNTAGMGGAASNNWQWVRDTYSGYEVWRMYLDLPASNPQAFEYAIVYKHGVINNAKTYEFWDNNGGSNYVVFPQ